MLFLDESCCCLNFLKQLWLWLNYMPLVVSQIVEVVQLGLKAMRVN